jgi:hypothetical protein
MTSSILEVLKYEERNHQFPYKGRKLLKLLTWELTFKGDFFLLVARHACHYKYKDEVRRCLVLQYYICYPQKIDLFLLFNFLIKCVTW